MKPLHKATHFDLGTQVLYLLAALKNLPGYVFLRLFTHESHRYSLGNGHIDLHAHNLLAERVPDPDLPPLLYNMHTHFQHVRPIPNAREPPALLLEGVVYNNMGQAYHYRHPLSTMAYIGGTPADTALTNRLQHELATALYFSALDSALLPVHLQTQRE